MMESPRSESAYCPLEALSSYAEKGRSILVRNSVAKAFGSILWGVPNEQPSRRVGSIAPQQDRLMSEC